MNAIFSHTSFLAGVGMLCAVAVRGLHAWRRCHRTRSQQITSWKQSLTGFQRELESRRSAKPTPPHAAAWKGYRRFVVAEKIVEAENICSLYIKPEDGRHLPAYEPGQYLTLQLTPPGAKSPLVRCYSLSDRPQREQYRLTVKAVGKASDYLYHRVLAGEVLLAQAPRGDYHLQREDQRPVVLVAAGIGITPVFSMLSTLLHHQPNPPVVLFYGVRNSREHAFRHALHSLATQHAAFQYVPCYSQPLPADRQSFDYVSAGRIDLALIQKVVPHAAFPFYLCGPGSFMEQMVPQLQAWGVADEDLHYEAFGPSTVKRIHSTGPQLGSSATTCRVIYKQSGKTAMWDTSNTSILEQAESQEIPLPSGCRSGNCGLCAVKLLAGDVKYGRKPTGEIPAGHCLTCIAEPASDDLILDA